MAFIHKNITVAGRVQGVYFRASAKFRADQLGVSGLVKNEASGAVYAEAEGDPGAVDEFVAWCRTGPPAAHVTGITVTEGILRGYEGFRVIR